jgi:RHH-type transcriptional regulator, rel operon repressor / antitoxin RelB
MPATPTISLRLPKDARERLDRVATKSRRSRSYIIQEALERHLDEIEREELDEPKKGRLSTILNLAGAGTALNGPRSKEEIDAHIRWLRRND